MKQYAVVFSDSAWGAIESQIRYIAIEKRAPANAAKWVARLLSTADSLARFPRRHSRDENQSKVLGVDVHRLVFERAYLLHYTVDDEQHRVNVVSFYHGSRDMAGA